MLRHKLLVPSAVLVMIGSLTVLSAWAQGACGCGDVKDIRNRICIAKAAISEYNRLIRRARNEEKKLGKPIMLTPDVKEGLIKACVQEAVETVITPGSRQAKAETNNACEVVVTRADSVCMRSSVEIHEGRHANACQWRRDQDILDFIKFFKDTREGQTVVGYMNEEKSGYQAEINYLRSELMSLSFRCPRGIFEVENKENGRREFTIEFCPPPKPRPPANQSDCAAR